LVATHLHEEEKPESVEKVGGSHSTRLADHVAWLPATTGHQTDFSKSMEVPFTPINTPLTLKVDTHIYHILEIPLAKLSFLV
jgi:hypothetical protein